jgi:type IV secretory pathway VirD2 relaxase
MGAHRSVVKHSYLTGKDKGVARAQAHVRYIQFRGGKDKEEGTRSFFNDVRDEIYSGEVREAVSDQNPRGTVMHKLILSPGVQGADVKEYCREVMADLSSRKGLDLEWYGVQHENTDNPHVHIVVMGTDQNGHKVRLNKEDYTKIKEAGDRYLERNRLLDREEKDKEKDKDEKDRGDRNPAARFFDALKAAERFRKTKRAANQKANLSNVSERRKKKSKRK